MTRQALKSNFETGVPLESFSGSVAENAAPLFVPKQALPPVTSVHPAVTATMVINDPRWKEPKVRFSEFLNEEVAIDRGALRGRDVLIQIALLPVCLAIAATLIGLVWSILHLHA
jgi:hypothetical protein